MFKKSKFYGVLGFLLIVALTFNTTVSAQSPNKNTLDGTNEQASVDAKEYLTTYRKVDVNEFGNEFTTEYQFNTSQDLDGATSYITKYGLDAFDEAVRIAIEEALHEEEQLELIMPRTTYPTTAYATISGNGTHTVSAETYGLASFDTLGTVEYSAILSYKVPVSNGKITGLSSISFDIPHISAAGSWGNLSLPSYNTSTHVGVTANYTITKTVEISIGDFEFVIKSETDNEVFALLTNLE